MCFNTLNCFGKETESLEDTTKGFSFVLKDYSINEIEAAFKMYLMRNTVFPAPADILKIINPSMYEKFDTTTFLEIKNRLKNPCYFATDQEKRYVEMYVDDRVNAVTNKELMFKKMVSDCNINETLLLNDE